MLIPPRSNYCIWCGCKFAIAGFKLRGGEVLRSQEHIIAASVFGRLKTQDVCIGCNSRLGTQVDHFLLNDGGVVTAGVAAGFKHHDFRSSFRVDAKSPSGQSLEYKVTDGVWRLKPEFSPTGFRIGAANGSCTPKDLENAKRKMLRIVMADISLDLSEQEIQAEVDDLFEKAFAQQTPIRVYSPAIKQGIESQLIRASGTASIATDPWKTQWCIAKFAFETGMVVLPEGLRRKAHDALGQLKHFVEARQPMKGVFSHRRLRQKAQPTHWIEVRANGASLKFRVALFCREQWTLAFNVLKRDGPGDLEDFRLEVVNHCLGITLPTVRIVENGRQIEFG